MRGQRHALGEALRTLRDDRVGSALAIFTMGASFAAALAALAFLVALPSLPARLGAVPVLAIYLQADATDADAQATQTRLRTLPEVSDVRRIGRDAALREVTDAMGLNGIGEGLPHNPLPETVIATLREPTPEALDRLRTQALGWPKVEAALFDRDAAQQLDLRTQLARRAGMAVCIAFGLLAMGASAAATLRWMPARLPAMRLTRSLGGTPAQVLAPGIYAGALQALAAVLAAISLGGLAAWRLAGPVETTFAGAATWLPSWWSVSIISVAYVAVGATMAAALSHWTARKHGS